MIQALIFSMDRAMQLDATLRSFFKHCKDSDDVYLTVLYRATDKIYERQYQELSKAYSTVKFVQQHRFRKDVLTLLNPYPDGSFVYWMYRILLELSPSLAARIFHYLPHPMDERLILFLVDDNLFVRDFDVGDVAFALSENSDSFGFSLRLGANTTYSYMLDHSQTLPNFVSVNEHMLKYQWLGAEDDFGYPFEVSSSIYRVMDFLSILLGLRFDNPNALEGRMALQTQLFARTKPTLLCFETSVAFCNPINKVQSIFDNRTGIQYHYSPEKLAELFNEGYRINVETYNNFISNSCHQEVELKLERLYG